MLLEILVKYKNRREVAWITRKMMSALEGRDGIAAISTFHFFRAGAFEQALAASDSITESALEQRPQLRVMIDELHLLFRDTPDPRTINDQPAGTRTLVREFNWRAKAKTGNAVSVVFYLQQGWHHSIQSEIAESLLERGVSCRFADTLEFAVELKPRVLVISEALYGNLPFVRDSLPRCAIVNTRHGLGDKNHAAVGGSQADYICLSSTPVADLFESRFLISREKIWVTGYPQMDSLFRDLALPRHRKPNDRPKVLFAPTYDSGLSAGLLLADRVIEAIRGDDAEIEIHIRPHPHLNRDHPSVVAAWRDAATRKRHVYLYADDAQNIMTIMPRCDLMVSDVSSAALAWLATGRPLVCIVHPEMAAKSVKTATDGTEWRMHEAATLVTNPSALKTAVARSLSNPRHLQDKRDALRDFLFGDFTDGTASRRIADRIENLLGNKVQ